MTIHAIIQIILGVALTAIILIQGNSSGLGSTFGGGSSYHTKRGMEKTLYIATIVLLVLFITSSILLLI